MLKFFFNTFKVLGIISDWLEHSLEDGKIQLTEMAALAEEVGAALGIPVEYNIKGLEPGPPDLDTEETQATAEAHPEQPPKLPPG